MLGMHGSYAANRAVVSCDLLLAFGVRFDERSTAKASLFAPAARIVHFNVEPGEINKIIPVQVAVPGNLQESLPLLRKLAEPWAAQCRESVEPLAGTGRRNEKRSAFFGPSLQWWHFAGSGVEGSRPTGPEGYPLWSRM